jgi:hypothetical protein
MKKIKRKLNKAVLRGKKTVSSLGPNGQAQNDDVPRITNDTVAEHREEVLSSARKYIYPLQHSRHRIVIVSITIFVLAVVLFFTYTLLALYRFHSTSTFVYRITQVIPFPVAKAGPSFVAYENYLFEIRRYIHYYETQQDVDFATKSGQEQLADFKKRALEGVVNEAYVKQLAKQHKVSVSRGEVNDQINLLKSQNRLGGNEQVFEDVLREFWGWSVDDFRRELRQQLLAQKVVAVLDTNTQQAAQARLGELQAGGNFAEIAKVHSDDEATKPNGGEYGFPVEISNRDIQPRVLDALFKLQPNQTSNIIETPTGLEIVKVYENNSGKLRAAHMLFQFESINKYIEPIKKQNKPTHLIDV